ncbi:unnamed protein product, partial [Ectocarpus sp. 12 AP-2014]
MATLPVLDGGGRYKWLARRNPSGAASAAAFVTGKLLFFCQGGRNHCTRRWAELGRQPALYTIHIVAHLKPRYTPAAGPQHPVVSIFVANEGSQSFLAPLFTA